MRAAHFLLQSELACSPPNDAIITAYHELGIEVDLYAPDPVADIDCYNTQITISPVQYGRRWLLQNMFSSRWRRYNVFSGTSEDPMAVVGVLSALTRRPSFCLADEIRSGSYYGNAPEIWKKLCRWGMRRARFNIVNDPSRVVLQADYAGLGADARIIVYPGCFKEPPQAVDRSAERRRWGIPDDAFVIGHSGWFNEMTGGDWVLEAVKQSNDHYAVLQPMVLRGMMAYLLANFTASDRVYIEQHRLSWKSSWASMAAVDVGIIVYRNQAPQFQNMGTSSNKLCMFLAMGVPVIALRQESFRFIEDYGCGILIEDRNEIPVAVQKIKENHKAMRAKALECTRDHIAASVKYQTLLSTLGELL